MAPSTAVFFVIAFGFSWAGWLPLVLAAGGHGEAWSYWHLLASLGPALGAFAARGLESGASGIADLGRAALRWRVGWRWHAVVWGGPVLLYFVAAVLTRLWWGRWSDFARFGTTAEFPELPRAVYWIACIVFYGFGEEIGWRGFLLPKFQRRHSFIGAAFLVAVPWTLWHLPLFFFRPTYQAMGLGGALGFFFSLLTGSVLLSWMFNRTRGSLALAAVLHGMIDVAFNSPAPGNFTSVMGFLVTCWGLGVWWHTSRSPSETDVRPASLDSRPAA